MYYLQSQPKASMTATAWSYSSLLSKSLSQTSDCSSVTSSGQSIHSTHLLPQDTNAKDANKIASNWYLSFIKVCFKIKSCENKKIITRHPTFFLYN